MRAYRYKLSFRRIWNQLTLHPNLFFKTLSTYFLIGTSILATILFQLLRNYDNCLSYTSRLTHSTSLILSPLTLLNPKISLLSPFISQKLFACPSELNCAAQSSSFFVKLIGILNQIAWNDLFWGSFNRNALRMFYLFKFNLNFVFITSLSHVIVNTTTSF